ncbi:hypothetical protein [Pseudomonas sp. TWP3-2]|uniref:hypothetical protein n=1 Tax=Pseudomonas sp. TWP3-2 TaxID=2804574 RepID=UPI003CF2715B
MDIQSSTLNSLFVLVPVIIQGWVSPVKPGDLAHGGIPWSIYDEQPKGLECLIDPWTEQKARGATLVVDDRVDLYLNNDANAVTGHTVKEGEEQQRILLYVPKGRLIHGVNRLHYRVKRAGGNIGENSRDLFVLYHLRPADTLDLVIPPKNIASGIGPVDGVQGVEFGFTYNNRRAFDSILFLLGDTSVSFDVPAAPAPITCKLFTDTFEKAGDNPRAVAEFQVTDQLGNVVKSPAKSLDIHIRRLDLPAPTVQGQTGNNFTPTQQDVKVLVPLGTLLPTDNMYVTWKGAISTPAASFTSPKRLVSAGLEVVVPRSVLAYSLSKVVEVIYVIERNGVSTTSKPLLLNILPLPVTALIPPKILEADANNVLDVTALGASNATIHALLFTLIEDYQPCWLSVEGKKSDGTAHKLDLWKGLPWRVNPTWLTQGFWPQALANTFLKQLGDGTQLTIKFKVSMNKSNVEATALVFPDRVYKIRAVALVVPTLEKVLAGTTEVLEGESTVSTSLKISGTASAHGEVEAFQGRGTTAVSLGKATADKSGYWERPIALQLGARRVYVKSLYHPRPDVFSNVRNFNVVANSVPQLLLITDTAGVEILHNGTTTGASIIVSGVGPPNTTLDLVNGGAFIPGGAEIQVNGRGIWTFELENLVVATYNLRARRKDGPVSNARNVIVVAATAPTITSIKGSPSNVEIPHGSTTVENSATLSGVAAKGLKVDVLLGIVSKGQPTADPVTGIWTLLVSGLTVALHSFTAKALYAPGAVSAARTFSVTAATAPTITSIKGSPSNVEIPHGSTTVETSVTLSGVAAKGLKVDVLLGTVSKGQPVADLVTGIWTLVVNGLAVALHSFKAKALYGSGAESAARTLEVITIAQILEVRANAQIPNGRIIQSGGSVSISREFGVRFYLSNVPSTHTRYVVFRNGVRSGTGPLGSPPHASAWKNLPSTESFRIATMGAQNPNPPLPVVSDFVIHWVP